MKYFRNSTFLSIFLIIALFISNLTHAAPPLTKTIFFEREQSTTLSLGYVASTIPLESLGLGVDLYDLEQQCAEVAISETFENRGGAVYLTLLGCFNADATEELIEGTGRGGSLGYFVGSASAQVFIELEGSRTKFEDMQTEYEISRGRISAGFLYSPFVQKKTSILVKNFSFGADYNAYSRIREKRLSGDSISKDEDGRFESDVTILARWGYSFGENFGVTLGGSFIGREELAARLYLSF